MKKYILIALAIGTLAACAPKNAYVENPEEYVSTLVGTLSEHSFSTGNTYPATATPWGIDEQT